MRSKIYLQPNTSIRHIRSWADLRPADSPASRECAPNELARLSNWRPTFTSHCLHDNIVVSDYRSPLSRMQTEEPPRRILMGMGEPNLLRNSTVLELLGLNTSRKEVLSFWFPDEERVCPSSHNMRASS